MAAQSHIEWTEATWNPVTGCSRISEGCRNCYAEALSLQRGWTELPWTQRNAAQNVGEHPERLRKPFSWKQPRRVFCASMADLYHEQVSDAFIARVFEVMASANKIQIKHAIEEVFANKKVQVLTVNILRVPGKGRRRGRSVGMTRSWKKAIVTLRAGQRLDLFEGV